ncbi:MAG: methionine--tRNA ligase [Cyclobacteriaceae bacterium]
MSKKQPRRITITSALPYANGPKHIGHLAGAYIPADVYARFNRMQDRDVLFVCGSDEHGTAIPNQALKEQTTSRAIIDKYHQLILSCFKQLDISFDIYHRTSEQVHHQTAQEFFLRLHEQGLMEEEVSEQYFDEQTKTFLADRYIIGTCPKCKHDHAYGDQCEKCGSTLSPRELIQPRSALSGNPPVLKPTKHWYLPLAKWEPWLREWILQSHQSDWKPNVYGQCKSWIDAGLQSRAMTRDLDWGIKVPLPDAEGKVLYVWFDAPIGYISATRAFFDEVSSGKLNFSTPQRDFGKVNPEDWKKYWQSEDTRLVHFIGKDNIVFHCIIFPVMLHAHGDFIVPEQVPANEFMNLEGEKMSTSRGWSIEMHEFLEDFPDKTDELRYSLLTNLPETKDSEFTWKDFQAKNNSELVAILGNFVNRALVLTEKNFGGKVPECGDLLSIDQQLLEEMKAFPNRIAEAIEQYRFREATALMIDLARSGNKYLADTEPWKLVKSDMGRVATILNCALQISASLSIVTEPFLPKTASRLRQMLNIPKNSWDAASQPLLSSGHNLGPSALLFQKIEDDVIEAQRQKLINRAAAMTPTNIQLSPAKDQIQFEDFSKMDIRIATILAAEKVEKSKKLLKLQVDTGLDRRTVMSGIAEHFQPEELIGKQVTLLANLAPRKIMGVESQGMILMAEDNEGKLRLLQPYAAVNPGSSVS